VPGGIQVSLGDAYGDERRRTVFQLHVPQLEALGARRVAEIVLRYVSVGEEIAAHEVTIPVTVNLVSADEAAAAEADHEVTEEVVVLMSARAQEQARSHADRGEFDSAKKVLGDAASELRRVAPGSSQAEELLAQGRDARGEPAVDVGRAIPGSHSEADAVPEADEPAAEEEARAVTSVVPASVASRWSYGECDGATTRRGRVAGQSLISSERLTTRRRLRSWLR